MKTLMHAAALGMALTTAAAVPVAMAQTAPAAADTMFKATTLNLSATGETRVAPNMASISLGVITEGKTAAEALAANATRMTAVMATLKKAAIAEKDIQTSNLSVNPQYRYVENQAPVLIGYQVSNQVTVTVRDLKKLGAAVDATVNAGANQVNGISFGLSDPSAAETAAREAAVRALSGKADLYARATGYRILRLVTLSEGGGYSPQPPIPMVAMAMRSEAKGSSPVSGGELSVQIDITAVYELTRSGSGFQPQVRQSRRQPSGERGVDLGGLLLGHPVAGRDGGLGKVDAVGTHRLGQASVHGGADVVVGGVNE